MKTDPVEEEQNGPLDLADDQTGAMVAGRSKTPSWVVEEAVEGGMEEAASEAIDEVGDVPKAGALARHADWDEHVANWADWVV